MHLDLLKEPIGVDKAGNPCYLKDIWPSQAEVQAVIAQSVNAEMFTTRYAHVFEGHEDWRSLKSPTGDLYEWDSQSTYVKNPPYFKGITRTPTPIKDIQSARVLALLGDSVTTDHISPAGNIAVNSPAGNYLKEHNVAPIDFNSYGARRGNHEVMMRGTFANIRLRNLLAPGTEGGWTCYHPTGEIIPLYDAAMAYKDEQCPLVIIAGKEYGTGSSRDWAAKGTLLLGVRAVIAQSFERIHRSNLIGMGVLPLQFKPNETPTTLELTGKEHYSLSLKNMKPHSPIVVTAVNEEGHSTQFEVVLRIDTPKEMQYYEHGGILQYVLRQLASI
jgi:aconitate hydratase